MTPKAPGEVPIGERAGENPWDSMSPIQVGEAYDVPDELLAATENDILQGRGVGDSNQVGNSVGVSADQTTNRPQEVSAGNALPQAKDVPDQSVGQDTSKPKRKRRTQLELLLEAADPYLKRDALVVDKASVLSELGLALTAECIKDENSTVDVLQDKSFDPMQVVLGSSGETWPGPFLLFSRQRFFSRPWRCASNSFSRGLSRSSPWRSRRPV